MKDKTEAYNLIRRVTDLCADNDMSIAQLCKITGIPQTSFSNWRNRGSMPSIDAIEKMAAALGVTVQYLRMGADEVVSYDSKTILPDYKKLDPRDAYDDEEEVFSLPIYMRLVSEKMESLDEEKQRQVIDIFLRIIDAI